MLRNKGKIFTGKIEPSRNNAKSTNRCLERIYKAIFVFVYVSTRFFLNLGTL